MAKNCSQLAYVHADELINGFLFWKCADGQTHSGVIYLLENFQWAPRPA